MPKIDPFTLKRRAAPPVSETFRDPEVPDTELTVTIRRMDKAQQLACYDVAEDVIAEYITGDPESGIYPIPVEVDGAPIELSSLLIRQCVSLERMQTAPVGERYGWKDWAAFAVTMPSAFQQVIIWSNKVQSGGDSKNSVAGAGTSSVPASADSGSTPNT